MRNERQNRGTPSIQLCQDKIEFYSDKNSREFSSRMPKSMLEETLAWWRDQLVRAERLLAREISSDCRDFHPG
jgi:hypothetical protein